jgi:NADH:ubiquinone oxidoreductase subunit 6 (subunit J)
MIWMLLKAEFLGAVAGAGLCRCGDGAFLFVVMMLDVNIDGMRGFLETLSFGRCHWGR